MPADRSAHGSSEVRADRACEGDADSCARRDTADVDVVVEDDAVSCQRCRQRKKRCDRTKPQCAGCVKSKIVCVYPADRPAAHVLSSSMAEIGRLRKRCKELEARVESLSTSTQRTTVSPIIGPIAGDSQSFDLPRRLSPQDYLSSAGQTQAAVPRLAEKVLVRLLTKPQDISSSFGGTIGQELGVTPTDEVEIRSANESRLPLWPTLGIARELLKLYYGRSYAMLPIVEQSVVEHDLRAIYQSEDESRIIDPNEFTSPDPRIFRLAMIFAIAQDLSSQRALRLFDVNANMLHAVTLRHLSGALQGTDLTAISCVALLVQISMMHFVKMAPHYVISVAASMAIEAGLNHENPSLPPEKQDESRRVFWSIFCMDRNTLMGKPVCISEALISTRLPSHVDGGTAQSDHMSPTLFFCQMVFLRRLQGIMSEAMRSTPRPTDPEAVFSDLRNKIDEWWANTAGPPLPSNGHTAPVPFLELQYNLLLVNLYRPSRLFIQTHPLRMPILRSAVSKSLQLYRDFVSTDLIPQNYVHMYSIVLCGISLLYVLGETEGDVRNLTLTSWRSQAIADIDACHSLISSYCEGWPWVTRFRNSFEILAENLRSRIFRPGDGVIFPAWSTSRLQAATDTRQSVPSGIQTLNTAQAGFNALPSSASLEQPAVPAQPLDSGTGDSDVWAQWVAGLADLPAIGAQDTIVNDDVEAFLTSLGLNDLTGFGFESVDGVVEI